MNELLKRADHYYLTTILACIALLTALTGCNNFRSGTSSGPETNSAASNATPGGETNTAERSTASANLEKPEKSFALLPGSFAVSFFPNGTAIAVRNGSSDLNIWDTNTGKVKIIKTGHTNHVMEIVVSSDGKLVATASDDGVKLWNAVDGSLKRSFAEPGHESKTVAISNNGKLIASGGFKDDTIHIWETDSGRLVDSFKDEDLTPNSIEFSPNGNMLAAGSLDNQLFIWDLKTGNKIGHDPLPFAASDVTPVFSPDSKMLATGSQDNTVRIWDVSSGKVTFVLQGHNSTVGALAFSADGKKLATGGNDNLAIVWDTNAGKAIRTIQGHSSYVDSVIFTQDGRTLITGSGLDKTVNFWKLD